MSDLDLLLAAAPALARLPPEARDVLSRAIERRRLRRGQYLFRQGGGPPEDVYYLESATVEIRVGQGAEEVVVSVSGPGDLVGWLSVFTPDPFPASARVAGEGEALAVRAEVLRDLAAAHPEVGSLLAAAMARRLQDLFRRVQEAGRKPLPGRPDAAAFRKRVVEVMRGPPARVAPVDSVRDAARAMAERGTGSALVQEAGVLRGILTEKDLVAKVLARGLDPDTTRAEAVMSSPVETVAPDAYVYRALGIMGHRRIRHLPVVEGGRAVGVVSMRDLLPLLTRGTIELVEGIEAARSFAELARVHREAARVCLGLVDEGLPGDEVARALTHLFRDIHRRALEIAMGELEAEGWGKPPAPFCFVVMGSHGREEAHLATDQDHGMILADYPPAAWGRVEPYFMELGDRVSAGLAEAGFPACRGHVMSRNPVWRKPLREWRDQARGWFARPDSNAVRYSTLAYDLVPIWGDVGLAHDLRGFLLDGVRRNFPLLRSLYAEAARHRVPLGWFRSFATERRGPHRGEIDLKRSGLLFVAECARILALRHGVAETSTIGRLGALAARGAMPAEEAEFAQTAYRTLLFFLLRAQAKALEAGQQPDTYLNPAALPPQERYLLRHALEAAGRLQDLVRAAFGEL